MLSDDNRPYCGISDSVHSGVTRQAQEAERQQAFMLFVPDGMNTMLRTYAWRAFFSETGVLNTILMQTGILEQSGDVSKE